MRVIFCVMMSVLLTDAALAGEIPTFDTKAYCAEVSQTMGGSYVMEAACIDQEKAAVTALENREIEPRISGYCGDVAQTMGGSYVMFKACVEQEEKAKAKLQN